MKLPLVIALALSTAATAAPKPPLPAGYWPESRTQELLAKTETIRLAPDLSRLTPEEQRAVKDLLEAGQLLQRVYEESRHPQALEAQARLARLAPQSGGPTQTRDLLTLYRLFQGPIATTLDNRREAFLPVSAEVPGRNVYPPDITREEADAFLARFPEQREAILGERTVVRRATKASLDRDLAVLGKHPVLAVLHPRLAPHLKSLAKKPDAKVLYAVPYPVAYANDFLRVVRAAHERRGLGGEGEWRVRPLPPQPRPRPALQRLREWRCVLGDGPLPAPQRADRRVRDVR